MLEYGVGNGRVALQIARSSVAITGVDLSAPMLADLRKKLRGEADVVRKRVTLVRGDMRQVRLRRRFPLVIAPFNTLLHLYSRSDVERFFACVRGHLLPRGRFIFDFSLPMPGDLCRDPARSYGAPPFRHPSTGRIVHYRERFDYDAWRQLLLVWMEFTPRDGSRSFRTPLVQRQFFPCEMEALLHYNGFEDIRFHDGFGSLPADRYSDSVTVTCRRRRGPARM